MKADVNVFNRHRVPYIRRRAYERISGWLNTFKQKGAGVGVVDTSSNQLTLEFEQRPVIGTSSNPTFWRFRVLVSIEPTDAFARHIETDDDEDNDRRGRQEDDEPEMLELMERVIEELGELAKPQPRGDGLWWADENYYPLRPMYEGEVYASGSAYDLKPVATWTVVNGVTGVVISEGVGDDDEDADLEASIHALTSEVPVTINRQNFLSMRDAAETRIKRWCEQKSEELRSLGPSSGYSGLWPLEIGDVASNKIEVTQGLVSFMTVMYLNGDMNEPQVLLHIADAEEWDREWARAHKDELQEIASPHPRSDGVWWADEEEMQLLRPVWEGETVPPWDDWVMIDPVTYEPVREKK